MEKRAATPGCGTPGSVVTADNVYQRVIFTARWDPCAGADNAFQWVAFHSRMKKPAMQAGYFLGRCFVSFTVYSLSL